MIRLACPSCSKKLAVEDSSAGSVCKCPSCANKFRVPDAAAPVATPARASAVKSGAPRDSAGRSSATGSTKPPPKKTANGVVLDQLEVIDDEPDVRPRRRAKLAAPERPQWVLVTAIAAAVLLCALAVGAIFTKYVAIALIVVGLPASLLSRRQRLIGGVGVGYLLTGAAFFLLHATVLKQLEGPPPRGASPQAVDVHCATLLKAFDKIDASSWVGLEKSSDTSLKRGLRVLVKGAYDYGASEVWLMNRKEDTVGLFTADLVVVLPDDEQSRQHVMQWYQRNTVGKRAPVAGEKYLYVPWD
jgi:hypothetical protein